MTEQYKTCECCQLNKPENEFLYKKNPKNKKIKEHSVCHSCNAKRLSLKSKEWVSKNREREKASRQKRMQDPAYASRQREYFRNYRKNNKDKCTEWTLKSRHRSKEAMQKHNEVAKRYQKKVREEKRGQYLLIKMRRHFRRICDGTKAKKSFSYIGVSSVEEFVSLMSSRTDNPNWLSDGYEIDHFWQMNWFYEFFNKNPEMAEDFYALIHHHSNIRPLEKSVNAKRSFYDFSSLKIEDFEKFKPFMDEAIVVGLQYYFDNKENFSGEMILKGSKEESEIVNFIRASGFSVRVKANYIS